MDIAALITWLITAGGGFVLLGTWVAKGGHRPETQPASRLSPLQVFSHFLLAATGLVLWIVYVAADIEGLRWIAFVILVAVALVGFSMFFRWLPQVRGRQPVAAGLVGGVTGDEDAAGSAAAGRATPEQRFPVPVVLAHGLVGATTLVLVLLAAARS